MYQTIPSAIFNLSCLICLILLYVLVSRVKDWMRKNLNFEIEEINTSESKLDLEKVSPPAHQDVPDVEIIFFAIKGELPPDFAARRRIQNRNRERLLETGFQNQGEKRFPSPSGW